MFRKEIDITKTSLFRLGLKEGERAGWEKGRKEGLEEGKKKGLIKGLKEAILLGVQIKFGFSKVEEVREKIGLIEDISKLREIKSLIVKEEDWNSFIKVLNDICNGKSKRSKSKNSKH